MTLIDRDRRANLSPPRELDIGDALPIVPQHWRVFDHGWAGAIADVLDEPDIEAKAR
jgi:hypothetical protein